MCFVQKSARLLRKSRCNNERIRKIDTGTMPKWGGIRYRLTKDCRTVRCSCSPKMVQNRKSSPAAFRTCSHSSNIMCRVVGMGIKRASRFLVWFRVIYPAFKFTSRTRNARSSLARIPVARNVLMMTQALKSQKSGFLGRWSRMFSSSSEYISLMDSCSTTWVNWIL